MNSGRDPDTNRILNRLLSTESGSDGWPVFHKFFKNQLLDTSTLDHEVLTLMGSQITGLVNQELDNSFHYPSNLDDSSKEEMKGLVGVESDLNQDESLNLPTKIKYNSLKKFPCVKFDSTLMLVEKGQSDIIKTLEKADQFTPIPKFIGYTMIAMRSKFEEELTHRVCFLETSKYPTHKNVKKLALLIYNYSDTQAQVEKITEKASGILIFCAILELLQKFEHRLIQFSDETSMFVKEGSILPVCRPTDFVILRQLNEYVDKVFLKTEIATDSLSFVKKHRKRQPCPMRSLLESYYMQKNRGRTTDTVMRNRLHVLLYRDFRLTPSTMQRYLMKFVLRSCIFFVRRYICVVSGRLRLLRRESWEVALESVVPQVRTFALHRMAQFLACTVTEICNSQDSYDLKVKLLKDVLFLHLDSIFYRQMTVSKLIVSTEPSYCHQACVCGLG